MKRLLSLLLIATLIFSFTACSKKTDSGQSTSGQTNTSTSTQNTNSSNQNTTAQGTEWKPMPVPEKIAFNNLDPKKMQENTLPITKEKITLKIYSFIHSQALQFYKDLSEHPGVQIMEDQTGLNLEFIHPPQGDDGTFFTTMIASGDYPDIINNDFNTYPGGAEAAMQDGVIIDMDEYVINYAPNYIKTMQTLDETTQKRAISDNGNIVRFFTMLQPPFLSGRVHSGIFIRKDLLEKYNLEMPVTIDDYTKVYQTFKDNGIKIPCGLMDIKDGVWKSYNPYASAFGVAFKDFYLKNGKVAYSRIQPEYKEFLTLMADWYKKGFISSDFPTTKKNDLQKSFSAGTVGTFIHGNWLTTSINKVGQQVNPDYYIVGAPYPRKNKNDTITLASQMTSVDNRSSFISATCKHPIEAVKFIDYLFMEDTQVLTAWGYDKQYKDFPASYETVNGARQWMPEVNKHPDYDFSTQRARYTLNPLQIMWMEDMEKTQYAPYPDKMETWEHWGFNTNQSSMIPTLITPTIDESREYSQIMQPIETYTDEMILKFIMGEESLDKFDQFVKQVKELGVDRATEIQQSAYTRFQNR